MSKTVKILVLNSEVEARLLSGLLSERRIDHMIRSYHDSAYDGLWQTQQGWGDLVAAENDRTEIMEIYAGMSENFDDRDAEQ
jgi:hypothetical protein